MARSSDRPGKRQEKATDGVLRPSDHIDSVPVQGGGLNEPKLGLVGYLRFFWRQLTSMRTALVLLLLLAVAAVPGSLVPQRSADPNGVTQYFLNNPDLAPILDAVQLFDVYTSAWFSAIYLLLFVSLVGCIIPRIRHHWQAMRARPPRTPKRLDRLEGFVRSERAEGTVADAVDAAEKTLKRAGYRTERYGDSISAERGYLRETGNLIFHSALVGVLVTVGVGGGFGYQGQKIIVEGQTFVNTLLAYDTFSPGRFFDQDALDPYSLTLDQLDVVYEEENLDALGQPTDFTAHMQLLDQDGTTSDGEIKVNHPLRVHGNDVFLLGNGYAPVITVRDGEGNIAFSEAVPFLPQDANLTSLGVVKVPDALPEQLGLVGFVYPTQGYLDTGAMTSIYPDDIRPVLSFNVYTGDLGVDDGIPRSVYELDISEMTAVAGRDAPNEPIILELGQTQDLPDGLGSVTFESMPRFVSVDVHHDPSQLWVLVFAVLVMVGLLSSLFIPRRRVWIRVTAGAEGGTTIDYAGLARGEDPGLTAAVQALAKQHADRL